MNETTILLSKDSSSLDFSKKESFVKKSCLVIFGVVCGLVIVFALLMTKWHLISLSVITPTVSHDVEFYPDADGSQQAQPIARNEEIMGDGADGSQQAVTPDNPMCCLYGIHWCCSGSPPRNEEIVKDGADGSQQAVTPDSSFCCRLNLPCCVGATAKQLGKAFPLTILAQIAWKDLCNMFNLGRDDLAQSVSMIPDYISEEDCSYAVNYFSTQQTISEYKDCQYVDLNDFVFGGKEGFNINECDESQFGIGIGMGRITNKIIDYFYENYENYLMDCQIVDIKMIKYLSNGTRYSGLHAETHYIDGKKIGIHVQVDYVGIVFLNDNFDGGNLQFIAPKSIDTVSPQIGSALLFGGGLDYSHRVTPVTNGHRYVLKIIFNKHY